MSALQLVLRGATQVVPAAAAVWREIVTRHHAYQWQDSAQTLREGLAEYYASGDLYTAAMTARTKRWFAAHDACHVLFGCATSPEQESVVDAWIMFGSTWQWRDYLGEVERVDQRKRILQEIFGEIGLRRTAFLVVATLPQVLEVRRRARQMHQPWELYGYERYLDYPLAQLRREFNIRLLSS